MKNAKVARLKGSDKLELLELLTQAFTEHPLTPTLGAKPEATRPVVNAFLNCFGEVEGSLLYGIRKDNKLVCASLSLDSTVEPSKLALMRFAFALYRAVGWRITREFEVISKEEPKYKDRYLELILLGTLPAYQRQGLGRKMLRFLYDYARKENYKGMILVAYRNSHAFHLYLRHGFIVDREFNIGEATLCWMRSDT
jgi:ribosomal protein S18 acetylase RimI-like enzyme